MKTLADFLGVSDMIMWGCVVYAAVQLLLFLLYKATFSKKGFIKLPYQGLLLLNVVVNIAAGSAAVIVGLGWNWGAILCVSMILSVIAMFECYIYYYWAIKNFRRDDV